MKQEHLLNGIVVSCHMNINGKFHLKNYLQHFYRGSKQIQSYQALACVVWGASPKPHCRHVDSRLAYGDGGTV